MAFAPSFPIRTIADIRHLEEIPIEKALSVRNTYEIFVNSAEAFADRIALRFLKTAEPGGETIAWTYLELLKGIHRTANMLDGLGVGPGDAISILLPACLEYHLALWGGEAAGIVNPLNPLLSDEKHIELMAASGTKVLVAYGGAGESDYWEKALRIKDQVPSLNTVLRVAPHDEDPAISGELPAGCLHFNELLTSQIDDHLISGRQIKPDDVAAYFHTGGTTGSPKLAMHTHANQVFSAWASVKLQGTSHIDKTINGFPLFHVAGVLPGSLTCLSAGVETIIPTTTLLRNREIIRNYWKLVDYHKITSVSAVPTGLAALAAIPLDGADISSVTFCRTGAAPMPSELSQRFKKLFDLDVTESLGMTEMAGITSITPRGVAAPVGCVGFPLPYSSYKIVGVDRNGEPTSEELGVGITGMVLVKSPNVFPGYLDKRATREVFTEDGWLVTGDLGFFDNLGRLNLRGRIKDLIIRSGHNIDPQTIEDALDAHPDVNLCGAVGAPDAYAGELPVAFVTLKNNAHASESELLKFVASAVDDAAARPKSVTILPAMPQTNVGKIYKPELRRIAAAAAVKNKFKTLMEELANQGSAVVEAHLDKNGKITIEVNLKVSGQFVEPVRAELVKFPLPVNITATRNS